MSNKTFNIPITFNGVYYMQVKAKDEDEAWEKASNLFGPKFFTSKRFDYCDIDELTYEIDDVEEVE